jgi:hypothetical protein
MSGDTRDYAAMATPGDVGPGGEGLGAAGPEICGGVVVSAAGENVGDLIMGGKEALNLPRRLEPLHDPLSSSGSVDGSFRPGYLAPCAADTRPRAFGRPRPRHAASNVGQRQRDHRLGEMTLAPGQTISASRICASGL